MVKALPSSIPVNPCDQRQANRVPYLMILKLLLLLKIQCFYRTPNQVSSVLLIIFELYIFISKNFTFRFHVFNRPFSASSSTVLILLETS